MSVRLRLPDRVIAGGVLCWKLAPLRAPAQVDSDHVVASSSRFEPKARRAVRPLPEWVLLRDKDDSGALAAPVRPVTVRCSPACTSIRRAVPADGSARSASRRCPGGPAGIGLHGDTSCGADTGLRAPSRRGLSSGTSLFFVHSASGTEAINTNNMPWSAANVVRVLSRRSRAVSAVAGSTEMGARATSRSASMGRAAHRR